MAFIRRHRLMLVPVLVAAAFVSGLVFVLRSQSEEPAGSGEPGDPGESGGNVGTGGNVSPTYPRETVEAWQEVISKRFRHGREYGFIHTAEHLDPGTNEVVTDMIVSTVRERGTNVCCRDEAGDWVPTIAEWEEGGLGFRMKRNSWQVEVPLRLGNAYDYTVGGRTLAMQPGAILLSDGTNTVSLGSIDTTVQGRIDPADPSKLVFADVLGESSGVDIELVLECAALHQNVVLRSKPSLPQSFNEETARLYVYTELGLDALTADGTVGVEIGETPVNTSAVNLVTARNTRDPITFTAHETFGGQGRENVLHRFVESAVWDSAATRNDMRAARQLWRNPNDLKTYLVESIPYSFVANATGALTIDYESRNGDITADETWTADATYYVSGDVNIGEDVTLAIEPGAVVKLAEDAAINVTGSGAAIIARGEPYRYIVFTSEQDDDSGEDLTEGTAGDPSPGDYDEAINVGSDASTDCAIAYCKIGYATKGIQVDDRDFGVIKHCIIRSCSNRGIGMSGSAIPDVFNNLIASCGVGIWVLVEDPDTPNCTIRNNTIDGGTESIYIHTNDGSPWPSATFVIRNNLVFNYTSMGIVRYPLDWSNGGFTLSNNAYDATDPEGPGPYFGSLTRSNYVDLTVDPYDTSNTQLGAYFIDASSTPGGGQLVDAGSGSPYSDPSAFSIEAPQVVDSDITADTDWDPGDGDTGTVDIGYHHPRLDYVVNNTEIDIGSSSAVELDINPGAVVAFSGSSAKLQFATGATASPTLTCEGDPDEPIVLAGKPAVSMDIEAKREGAGILRNKPTSYSASASIRHTRFTALSTGVRIERGPGANEVEHCVFERCQYALCVSLLDPSASVRNCLFSLNDRGCWLSVLSLYRTVTVRNCTYDRCDQGVYAVGGTNRTCNILDCLFTNCGTGVSAGFWATWNENYCAYWNCDTTVLFYNAREIGTNSMVLLADPYDPAWFDEGDPASSDWGAQWYLLQDGSTFSLCVDGGSQSSHAAGLDTFTTKLDSSNVWFDIDQVDIGYHYPVDASVVEDIGAAGITVTGLYFNPEATPVPGSVTITIDLVSAATWSAVVKNADETSTIRDDLGSQTAVDPVVVEWNGYDNDDQNLQPSGVYVIIVSIDGFSEDLKFYVYLDRAAPTGFEITWPGSGDSVLPY